MPTSPTPTFRTPFGQWPFLRSTKYLTKSAMFAHDSLPTMLIDGVEQRVLYKGAVLAEIASGPDAGKVGVFQDAGSAADEVQTITGTTVTAGTFDVTLFPGTAGAVTITDIAFNATAAAIQTAFRAAVATSNDADYRGLADEIAVTGGPVSTTALTVTYNGSYGMDVPPLTVDTTDLTGSLAVATTTAGVVGANDGRGNTANIVGVNNTFLPWQLMHRDVEVSVIYQAALVQANCWKLNAAGVYVPLDDTTAAAMDVAKGTHFTFHTASSEI